MIPLVLLFFLKIVWSFVFLYKFYNFGGPNSVKNAIGNLTGVTLNLQIPLGSVAFLTILILPPMSMVCFSICQCCLVKNPPAMQETQFDSWVRRSPGEGIGYPYPCGSPGKESTCHVGDLCLIPELGGQPGEGNDYPFKYSGLENSMDCIIHGVAKSRT